MPETSTPSQPEIRLALERVLESEAFARATRARDLLRYLVNCKLAGELARLKETSIALDVFGRIATTYDSASDGIVRVSANRLRELLDRYYADNGRDDALRFEIQRGGYVPIIRRVTPAGLPKSPRIAVLPLVNFTGETAFDALADGLTEDLIDAMTRVPGVRVTARTSSFRYKGQTLDARQIASELGVDALLEGSVQFAGDRLRITAQLILGHDGTHLWSHGFEGSVEQRGPLQAALIEVMIRSLGRDDASSEPVVAALEVERAPQLARNLVDQARTHAMLQTVEALRMAESLAREATVAAPEFVTAWSTLADVLMLQRSSWFLTWSVALESIRAPLRRALELSPDHPSALSLRGYDTCVHESRWDDGIRDCERAARLAPNNSVVLSRLAAILLSAARFPEATATLDAVLELDPYSPVNHYWRSMPYMVAGDWDAALQVIANGRRRLGNLVTFDNMEFAWGIEAGRYAQVLPLAEAVASANPQAPVFAMRTSQCLAGLGRIDEARAQFAAHANRCNPYQRDYLMLAIEACGSDHDRFYEHAARAVDAKCPNCILLPIDPLFRRFHNDSRWTELMLRLNRETRPPFYPVGLGSRL